MLKCPHQGCCGKITVSAKTIVAFTPRADGTVNWSRAKIGDCYDHEATCNRCGCTFEVDDEAVHVDRWGCRTLGADCPGPPTDEEEDP